MIYWGNFKGFVSTGIHSELLYSSLVVTAVAIALGVLMKSIKQKWHYTLWVLLIEYLFVVVCSTVICRGVQSFTYAKLELTPFWTYRAVLAHTPGVSVWDIVLNVVLFVPLGFLVKLLYPNMKLLKILLIAVVCSVFIETNQYFYEKGIAQFDDVMHNTIGAAIGWGLAALSLRVFEKTRQRKGRAVV